MYSLPSSPNLAHLTTKPVAFIIENDLNSAHIYDLTLQITGYQVEIIQNGKSALERLLTTVPDLIVLDLHLPHISGVELLYQIRTDKRFANTKVVITTGDAFLAAALSEQSELVLLKPVSINKLRAVATIYTALES